MLAKIVPFEQSVARHHQVFLPEFEIYSARDMYDWIVAKLERETVDPTPTGYVIDRKGRARPTWSRHR